MGSRSRNGAKIWDTRKTIPGLRSVEKAAVLAAEEPIIVITSVSG